MGYNLVSGGTDNHLVLIDLRNKGLTGKVAEESLEKAKVTLNKNMVPFDDESPFVTSGIRIGSPAMTTRGFGEVEFKRVAELINQVLQDPEDHSVIKKTKSEVEEMCDRFPLYDFVTA
jgi:glycine hydroxymethyltransferase